MRRDREKANKSPGDTLSAVVTHTLFVAKFTVSLCKF